MRTRQTKDSVGLSNGDFFDYNTPETHDYDINTIAHSLAKICRYNGHTDLDWHYSVAEHCVHVSRLVPPEMALEGLLHDASEAYTGDIQKPLKEMLPEFKKIEDRIEQALAAKFDLRYPFPPEIKVADKMVYQAERQQVATSVADSIWNKADVADIRIKCLPIRKAREQFLARYEELTSERDECVRQEREAEAAAS